jgi:hypothetical protein
MRNDEGVIVYSTKNAAFLRILGFGYARFRWRPISHGGARKSKRALASAR